MNEREGIKHHLMDFLETEEEYQVTSFLKDASQKVRKGFSIRKFFEFIFDEARIIYRSNQFQKKNNYQL